MNAFPKDEQPHAVPAPEILAATLPDGVFEPSDRPGYVPYEPTPGEPFASDVAIHQQKVHAMRSALVDSHTALSVSPSTRDMIFIDYKRNQAIRDDENAHSFERWRHQDVQLVDTNLLQIEHRIRLGTVSPEDCLLFMRRTTLSSSELANLFHAYGWRMEHLPAMRTAVEEAIVAGGGVVIPADVASYRKIVLQPHMEKGEANGLQVLKGFLVTYKRDMGYVTRDDGRRICVIERQSAAIDLTSEAIDDEVKALVVIVSNADQRYSMQERFEAGRKLQAFVEESIQSDSREAYFIPLSTTAYGAVESEKAYEARQATSKQYGGTAVSGALQSEDPMLYVNPNDPYGSV